MYEKYMIKCIIVGNTNVGKSSLINNLLNHNFYLINNPTIGVEYGAYNAIIKNKYDVKLQIWDTAGQESFRSIIKNYYRCSGCAIIVFDLTNKESFKSTLDEIREADILIHLVDISASTFEEQIDIVNETLLDINIDSKPIILVFNKIDKLKLDDKELKKLNNTWMSKLNKKRTNFAALRK